MIYIYYFGEVWNSFCQGLIFMVTGIYIKKYSLENKVNIFLFLLIILYISFISENYMLKCLNIQRDNNASIVLIFLSFCIFISLLQFENKYNIRLINKFSNEIKRMSFTIYLIHPIIATIVLKTSYILGVDDLNTMSYAKFLLVSLFSIIVSYIAEKIKELDDFKYSLNKS